MEIRHYVTPEGTDPFQEWLDGLKDLRGRVAVLRRVDRIITGNFGDCRFCRDGVWELRIDVGPGYRVYYAELGGEQMLLLGGGPKRTQQADIIRAARHLYDFRRRQP